MDKNPKISVVYDFKKKGSDEKGTSGVVWVRVYEARARRKYISTGVRVLPSEWSDVYHVIRRDDAEQLNAIIDEQVEKCKEMIKASMATAEQSELPTATQMKVDRSDASFLDWLSNKIDECQLTHGTIKNHKKVKKNLEEWGVIRRFEHVTPANLKAWIEHVNSNCNVTQVSLYDYWKCLRKWLRIAVEEKKIPASALYGVSVPRGKSKMREHLSDDEIERWVNTPMPNRYMSDARDRFIVQMGTGLAYADLMEMDFSAREIIDGNVVLVGRRVKTGETFFVYVLPMAVNVLEKWRWQVPSISMQDYNRFLKDVAKWCQINKPITSHVARHTYACYCLRHGVRIEAVQRTLGHSRLETTQIYARLVDMDVLEAFKGISKKK